MLPLRFACLYLTLFSASFVAAEAPLPARVSFNRDIRPIMSDTCFHCHGFDAKTREAGLRLDLREEALKKTENDLLPIIPGKPELSEVVARVLDEDDPMPPEKAHKPLTARQKALFKQWVAEGAIYEPHWAYAPLLKPKLPAGVQPIDFFIQARLKEESVTPSPKADPAKLLRRLSLDLIGLPPTPEDVAKAKSIDVEIKRLLASPHFGERWAVWWLDIARYADTVGFHGDQNQRIYPYRDYVINAFNSNKRFDAFTREQLAGDLLSNPNPEALVATGYNRLNMMTREGGAQPKEYLAKYGAERVRSVAAAWFGSTFGCAECHDHKFDPIKTRDFYELQAFFADVKQWGVYADYGYTPNPELAGMNNDYPFPPEMQIESPYLIKRLKAAQAELEEQLAKALKQAPAKSKAAWLTATSSFLKVHKDGWLTPAVKSATFMAKGKPMQQRSAALGKDGSVGLGTHGLSKEQTLEVTLPCGDMQRIASLRLEVQPDGGEMKEPKLLSFKATLLRANGQKQGLTFSLADATKKAPAYEGGKEQQGIARGWKIPHQVFTQPLTGVYVLDTPQTCTSADQIVLSFSSLPKAVRISVSPLAALEPLKLTASTSDVAWFLSAMPDAAALKRVKELQHAVDALDGGRAWSMVTQAANPLEVRVLPRGNFMDQTGAVVLPSTPSFLPGRKESTAKKRLTRLDLANWLTSEQNPITARAVMNRLWQQFFGTGLSAVVDDLGSQGELPSHPELLDWLASEFRDSGWDMKHMMRLIVTSHTYQQSSSLRPELKEKDPANRLLASQNPRRLEAEFVRDNALAIADMLNLSDIGGPSAKPYQPDGYYEPLQFPSRSYKADADKNQWRRGLYMHWQRTFLHPMLANFDAPARDECAALRTVSNTPQQALTLLNDPSFVEAARKLAERVLNQPGDNAARLSLACQYAWARSPKEKEAKSLAAFLTTQLDHYGASTTDAEKLLKVGQSLADLTGTNPSELAAWTSLCRVLLNAQETITRY